jgi:chromate transport protein ChrA
MAENRTPRIRDLVSYFLRLGTFGFGCPVALCGLMEKELVQDRGWLTKQEMRDAIAVSQSLPGPLAIQVGIFAAYLRGLLGRVGGRMGLHPAEFLNRGCARRALCSLRDTVLD